MGLAGDHRVTDQRLRREPAPARFGAGDAHVVPLRRSGEPLAERLERERVERERMEGGRRARIERPRAERHRVIEERLEQRRRERLEKLRRQRAERRRRERYVWSRRKRAEIERPRQRVEPARPARPEPSRAEIKPAVKGPVRKRARAAENRRRVSARRRGLFWPTAKAGVAVTAVLAVSAALGYSVLGLPVPGLDVGSGRQSLASSAAVFGVDPGTPPGLASGFVFPLIGPRDFGEADARFGAPRYGHVHEGQDIFSKVGTPEVAVHDGVVVDRGTDGGRYSGGRGNYIAIYSPADNRSFVYMHMLKPPAVQVGDRVHAGQLVGRLGCSGSCFGPHLHFEVRIGKATLRSETKAIDPLPYLRQWPEATPS